MDMIKSFMNYVIESSLMQCCEIRGSLSVDLFIFLFPDMSYQRMKFSIEIK